MPKKKTKIEKSAKLFDKKDLAKAAKSKDSKDIKLSDLTTAQLTEAGSAEVVAIVDGDQITILEPTGDLASALIAVKKEKAKKK